MQSEDVGLLIEDKRLLNQPGVIDSELLEEGLWEEARGGEDEVDCREELKGIESQG